MEQAIIIIIKKEGSDRISYIRITKKVDFILVANIKELGLYNGGVRFNFRNLHWKCTEPSCNPR
jgi:hypothetical protein